MGPYAFSQAFLCGFFAFASLSSIVLWWGARQERTLLILSIVCAIGVLQTYAALLVASATTVPDAQLAIQLRTMGGALNVGALAWLFAGIASIRARPYLWIVTTILLSTVAVIVFGIPVLGGRVIGIERVLLPWGESFTALERTPSSPLTAIVYLTVASTIAMKRPIWTTPSAHQRNDGPWVIRSSAATRTAINLPPARYPTAPVAATVSGKTPIRCGAGEPAYDGADSELTPVR